MREERGERRGEERERERGGEIIHYIRIGSSV